MLGKFRIVILPLSAILVILVGACSSATTATTGPTQTAAASVVAAVQSATPVTQATTITSGDVPGGMPPGGNPPSGNPPSGTPGGAPPNGNPPSGAPGGAPPGGNPPNGMPPGGAGSSSSSVKISGAYTVDGKTADQSGQTYTASSADQSAIYVLNGGNLTLKNATIRSSGNSSSSDSSSFYGLNAGVLAASGSKIDLSGSTVTTTGNGANGVFATGTGSSVTLSNTKINCTGQYAHAVMATLGGTLVVTNVDMATAGASSGAVATDRGGGTIKVTGGSIATSGSNAPGIYSTGSISISNAKVSSTGSEVAVIEGANSITLANTSLTSSKEGKWGVMIYQSFSGDAEGNRGTFAMTGGSLKYTSTSGPLFYVTNTIGNITLKGVDVTAASGTFIQASAGNWGNNGSNGGTVILTADGQSVTGNLVADKISSITVALQNGSSLTGSINSERTAKAVNLSLDAASTWNVTAESYLIALNDSAGISGTRITNITGNGHTVYYDASANSALSGKTYTLNGGGYLKPAN